MQSALLLSAAYSWFIGLLVMMLVMAVLFIVLALAALKPVKFDGVENGNADALKLLNEREAELTIELLSKRGDGQHAQEVTEQLREVAAAKKIVKELLDNDNSSGSRLGVDTGLTEEEAASLDSDERVSIENTFGDSSGSEGLEKSFSAKLIQSSDEVKVWYFELKNCILCYEKTKARMRWNNEKFYIGRTNVATLTLRGKQLCMYLAVNADDYSGEFPVKNSTSEIYKEVTPCLFRIKNAKCLKLAKELIAIMMSDYGVMYVKTNHSVYALPYEDDDALVARGLARPSDSFEVSAFDKLPDVGDTNSENY